MNDQHTFVCHRMTAAQATGDRQAAQRGYAFDQMIEESPLWLRAAEMTFRPRNLVLLAIIGGIAALFFVKG